MENTNNLKSVDTLKYDSITEFLRDISYDGFLYKLISTKSFVFRGHSSNKYQLIPSALRLESKSVFDRTALCSIDETEYNLEFHQIVKELYLLRDFYKRCDKNGLFVDNIPVLRNSYFDALMIKEIKKMDCWLPKEMWPLASLAQHYGLSTRLLDWTHDINSALFFCVEDYLEGRNIPEGTTNIELWALNIDRVYEMENEGSPLKLVQPVYYGNTNLCAQQGLFTLWQIGKKEYQATINRMPLDELLIQRIKNDTSSLPLLLRIVLPGDSAKQIYDHINKLGYNASRLYPGYNGVVKSLKHDFILFEERLSSDKVLIAKR